MDQKKLKIAYHETGHAVMALICGQEIDKVSLREMDSPVGTDKYHAFLKLKPSDPAIKWTGEKAIQKIMVSLSGYASEILFSDGVAGIGGDDLTIAVNITEDLLQIEEFENWVSGLPIPSPSALDLIENPMIRAYINLKIDECVNRLNPYRPAIEKIAEELYKRDELSGEDVFSLFYSYKISVG